METVPFLRDIDDEKHYAQLLEVAYVEAYSELDKILKEWIVLSNQLHPIDISEEIWSKAFTDLARFRFVMRCTVQQSVDRRRRLAHVARRLADVVLDEEGTEK